MYISALSHAQRGGNGNNPKQHTPPPPLHTHTPRDDVSLVQCLACIYIQECDIMISVYNTCFPTQK